MIQRMPRSARFSGAGPSAARAVLRQNCGTIVKEYLYGKFYNMDNIKYNAMMWSSALQVLGRVWKANDSARKTRDTSEGFYRYVEALKTTIREVGGLFLSYIVLKRFINLTGNLLLWRFGLRYKPVNVQPFQGPIRKLTQPLSSFKTALSKYTGLHMLRPIQSQGHHSAPSLLETLDRMLVSAKNYFKGTATPIPTEEALSKFLTMPEKPVLQFTERFNEKRLAAWSGFINTCLKAFKKKPLRLVDDSVPLIQAANGRILNRDQASVALANFLEWYPVIIGAIPAVFLSGFALERYSQTHAEPLAQRVANYVERHSNKRIPARLDQRLKRTLDHLPVLAYSHEQQWPAPVYMQGAPAYGFTPAVYPGGSPFTPPAAGQFGH